ncbi:HAD family hydrolase [Candidatus Gottesmanbacteria bacterium]|nr:HAD family hydrolase [Candidatus Gottesmanbacteria bacterium]
MKFNGIKVLIWDFDGTFYKPNPALFAATREAEYRVIMAHTGWTRELTLEAFEKLYKKVYPSATETVGKIVGISTADAAVEMESYFDRRDFLARDERLIKLFKKLKGFRHIILANGVIARHKETLKVLGVPTKTFELFVTSEVVGKTKPHPEGFRYILNYTKLPPGEHLMIGDRDLVDLAPARALGMRTYLVWSDSPGKHADLTIPTVYEMSKHLLSTQPFS